MRVARSTADSLDTDFALAKIFCLNVAFGIYLRGEIEDDVLVETNLPGEAQMTSVTHAEMLVLKAVFFNHFSPSNGQGKETDIDEAIWSDCINDSAKPSGIEGKALSALVSTLCQKGFMRSSGSGQDRCVSVTRAGYDVIKAAE